MNVVLKEKYSQIEIHVLPWEQKLFYFLKITSRLSLPSNIKKF